MAPTVLLNAFVYVGANDFTGDSNKASLSGEGEAKERGTFRSGGWSEVGMGLRNFELQVDGWGSFGLSENDVAVFNNLGATQVVTLGPVEAEGSPAFIAQSGHFAYQPYGELGENAPFSLAGRGKDTIGVVRGQLAKAKGAVAATGALGSALNLGNVGASQYLYGTFHVFSSGTTITAVLESDDAVGFPSPTTRATVGPITVPSGNWTVRVPGPLAETHYRWRVSAITGSHTVAAAIGIQ